MRNPRTSTLRKKKRALYQTPPILCQLSSPRSYFSPSISLEFVSSGHRHLTRLQKYLTILKRIISSLSLRKQLRLEPKKTQKPVQESTLPPKNSCVVYQVSRRRMSSTWSARFGTSDNSAKWRSLKYRKFLEWNQEGRAGNSCTGGKGLDEFDLHHALVIVRPCCICFIQIPKLRTREQSVCRRHVRRILGCPRYPGMKVEYLPSLNPPHFLQALPCTGGHVRIFRRPEPRRWRGTMFQVFEFLNFALINEIDLRAKFCSHSFADLPVILLNSSQLLTDFRPGILIAFGSMKG